MGLFDFLKKQEGAGEVSAPLGTAEGKAEEMVTELVSKTPASEVLDVEVEAIDSEAITEGDDEIGVSEEESAKQYAGWTAITQAFEATYPGQKDCRHLSANPSRLEGGQQPLDAVRIYDGGDYWHFVTYGLSDIYDEGLGDNPELSRFGMEFTYKLKKYDDDVEEEVIIGTANLLQMLAGLTVEQGEVFGPYEYVYTGQTEGIDVHNQSSLTGFICVPDPDVTGLDTANGRLDFIEFIGMTDAELKTLSDGESVEAIYKKMPRRLTDYRRASLV